MDAQNAGQVPVPGGVSRRDFIRFSMMGSAVVASGATLAGVSGCSRTSTPATGYRHLRDSDLTLLRPLVPVLLAGAFVATEERVEQALQQMDLLLDSAVAGARADLFQLLDALRIGPARWFFTGTWRAFHRQDLDTLTQTVAHWSQRDNGLARLALRAIHQPLAWAWYLTEEGARSTGYPGPPKKVVAA
ncbi:Tat pathway signal protein [Isoalcanivorax indicus]|uniref:Tat pathway signal protein n=1 Tax=Isoalcanivorax indicus TaxID=2202653 RepID=UPI000DBABB39|nr:Tat pathway signal protein [Isoalcanivorax indicus]